MIHFSHNKEGVLLYEDTSKQIFLKEELQVKNYVQCFKYNSSISFAYSMLFIYFKDIIPPILFLQVSFALLFLIFSFLFLILLSSS